MPKEDRIYRQCLSCRALFPRPELIRIVHERQPASFRVIQPSEPRQVYIGRSAYLCLSEDCLRKALKGRKIQKALKTSIPDDILIYLNQLLKGAHTCGHTQNPNL